MERIDIYTLHIKDRKLLQKRICGIYQCSESINSTINRVDSKSNITLLFYLMVTLKQEKFINEISGTSEKKSNGITIAKFINYGDNKT